MFICKAAKIRTPSAGVFSLRRTKDHGAFVTDPKIDFLEVTSRTRVPGKHFRTVTIWADPKDLDRLVANEIFTVTLDGTLNGGRYKMGIEFFASEVEKRRGSRLRIKTRDFERTI